MLPCARQAVLPGGSDGGGEAGTNYQVKTILHVDCTIYRSEQAQISLQVRVSCFRFGVKFCKTSAP